MNTFFSLRSVTSHGFCYVESESAGQIGLSRQDFEKVELNMSDFGHIHYAIMAEIIFFLNYGVILRCYLLYWKCVFIFIPFFFFYRNKEA